MTEITTTTAIDPIMNITKKEHMPLFNIYHSCLANQDGKKFIILNCRYIIYITTEFNKYVIINHPENNTNNCYTHINISDTHIILAATKPTLKIFTMDIADINSAITQSNPDNPLLNLSSILKWQHITFPDHLQQYLDVDKTTLTFGIVKGIGNTFLIIINEYVLLYNPITNTHWDISYNESNAVTKMTITRDIDHIIVHSKQYQTCIIKFITMNSNYECKTLNMDSTIETFTFLSKYNFIACVKNNKCYIGLLDVIVNNPKVNFNCKWFETIIPFEDPEREFIIDIQIYNRILIVQTYKNIYAAVAISHEGGIPIKPSNLIWNKVIVKPSIAKIYPIDIKFNLNIIKDDHLEEFDSNINILWCSLLPPVQNKNSDSIDNIFAVTMNCNIYQIIYKGNNTFEAEHVFMSEMKPIIDKNLGDLISKYIFLDKYLITVPNKDELLTPQEIALKKIADNALAELKDKLKLDDTMTDE
jgi:hypothetical protein